MVTQGDYDPELVRAARSVLLELMRGLERYRDDLVLVGGSVPEFLCPEAEDPYVGSVDVDFAFNHLAENQYPAIKKVLLDLGYRQGEREDRFYRELPGSSTVLKVPVDFLRGQDVDLLFAHPLQQEIHGRLPEGGAEAVVVQVASVVPFLVLKALALDERGKAKDAWDIYYCLKNYPGGVEELVRLFHSYHGQHSVKIGLQFMKNHFASLHGLGPNQVVHFQEVSDAEEEARVRRDAYERVQYLLRQLGVIGSRG